MTTWHKIEEASSELRSAITHMTPPKLGQSRLVVITTDAILRVGHYLLVYYNNEPKPILWTMIPIPTTWEFN